MDEVTQQNSALVEENAAAAKSLEQQSQGMEQRVSFFRVGDKAPAAAAAPPVVAFRRPRAGAGARADSPDRRASAGRRAPSRPPLPSAPRPRAPTPPPQSALRDASWKEF